MLYKHTYDWGETTPTFTDDATNPFSNMSFRAKIDELTDEE